MSFRTLACNLPGVIAVDARTDQRFDRHCHDQFGIGILLQGAHASMSGRGEVTAESGSLITVNPGEIHDGRPIGGRPRSWSMLYFDPPVIQRAFEGITQGASRNLELAFPVSSDQNAREAFVDLRGSLLDHKDDDRLCRETSLLTLVSALLDRREPREAPPGRIGRTLRMIDDDPSQPVQLADLAREAGLSPFQLIRAFKRETGLTPHRFMLQKRLAAARRLVANGTPLAEAALLGGFSDQSHMTRLFRRTYGYTPGALAAACA